MKALVVDDVAYSRLITQRVLEGLGFGVVQAASGAEALCVLSKDPDIDLVISDLMMPDMDGVELFESAQVGSGFGKTAPGLKRDGEEHPGSPPPFILLTASPRPELLCRAKQGGFLDVLVKPLDPKRLAKTIDQCLRARSQVELGNERDADSLLETLLSQLDSVIQGCVDGGDTERLSHIRTVLDERLKLIAARSEATRPDAKAE